MSLHSNPFVNMYGQAILSPDDLARFQSQQMQNQQLGQQLLGSGIFGGYAPPLPPEPPPPPPRLMPKLPEKKSMFKQIVDDIRGFLIEHRSVIYFIAGALIVDHFIFRGALKARLQSMADKVVTKVEEKIGA